MSNEAPFYVGRGSKRNEPDHDTSLEENKPISQRSKLTPRTPPTSQSGRETKEPKMEEIKKLMMEMKNEIKEGFLDFKLEIKEDINEIKRDIRDITEEMKRNKEEVKLIQQEVIEMKEEWNREKEKVAIQIRKLEEKVERVEKDKIRNSLVISGISINTNNEDIWKETMENMLEVELKLRIKIKKAYKISEERCIIETNQWADKLQILKEKSKLRGKKIFIESALTETEQKIQKKIRDVARKEREKGGIVRVRYQKVEIDGKTWEWNRTEEKLIETKNPQDNDVPKN